MTKINVFLWTSKNIKKRHDSMDCSQYVSPLTQPQTMSICCPQHPRPRSPFLLWLCWALSGTGSQLFIPVPRLSRIKPTLNTALSSQGWWSSAHHSGRLVSGLLGAFQTLRKENIVIIIILITTTTTTTLTTITTITIMQGVSLDFRLFIFQFEQPHCNSKPKLFLITAPLVKPVL